MKRASLPEGFGTYFPFLCLILIITLLMPRTANLDYNYKKGSPWNYDNLIAEFDFPIYKTEEQISEELSKLQNEIIPYYRYSEDVAGKSLKALEGIDFESFSYLKPTVASSLKSLYASGILPDETIRNDRHSTYSTELLYVQKNKRATKYPYSEIRKQSDARAALLSEVSRAFPDADADHTLKHLGVYDLVVPNLVLDRQTSELVHSESDNSVAPTEGFVSAGTLIVSDGEIVTAEVEQILDSYKKEYKVNVAGNGNPLLHFLGNFFVAFALVAILFFVIFFTNKRFLYKSADILYVILLFLLSSISALVICRLEKTQFLLGVPFTVFAVYLQSFYRSKISVPIYTVIIMPLLFFADGGAAYFAIFLLGGLASFYLYRFFSRRWMQFASSLGVALTMIVAYFGFRLTGRLAGNYAFDILEIFIASFLPVVLTPFVFLFERIFGLLSISRLEELSLTSNKLLRELETKAPGTFQHSLQVASMADAVARAIDADEHLIRAGALYHDVGKIMNPLCFVENQSESVPGSSGYHSDLSPLQSASDILRHVRDGEELADKYDLPKRVKDFISTHHGTTTVSFFYNKFVTAGGDPSRIGEFRYPGKRPETKEQVILMICDTVEAASRTLKDNSPQAYSDFVEKMVAGKMKENQFDNANITLKELDTIKSTLKTYLAQLYHERITYPKSRK